MVRIAFVVEGQTERIFIENLLNNFYSHPNFNVTSRELRGYKEIEVTKPNYKESEVEHSFLILDVGGDGKVPAAIFERAPKLINENGYAHVIGVRDLFPHTKEQLATLQNALTTIFNGDTILTSLTMIVAVMEVEAWFLADYPLFERIDRQLSAANINTALGINIETDDLEAYPHPAKTVERIFQITDPDYRYKKNEAQIQTICGNINYDELCANDEVLARIPSFRMLIERLDEF